jgi:competence protein ComEA
MLQKCLSILAVLTCLAATSHAQNPVPGNQPKPLAIININTATSAELEALPGIGPKVAARIVEYRKTKGPFKKIEELMNVQGVGEKSFLKLRPQLTTGTGAQTANQQ